MANNAELKLTC